jgi:hypothetical protein
MQYNIHARIVPPEGHDDHPPLSIPVGHTLTLSVLFLDGTNVHGGENVEDHVKESLDIPVDGALYHLPISDPTLPLAFRLHLWNYVRECQAGESPLAVADLDEQEVRLSIPLAAGPSADHRSHSQVSMHVWVKWFQEDMKSERMQVVDTGNAAVGEPQRRDSNRRRDWRTTTLFTFGPNHTKWVPSRDAMCRVLVQERVHAPFLLDDKSHQHEDAPPQGPTPAGAIYTSPVRTRTTSPRKTSASSRKTRPGSSTASAQVNGYFPIALRMSSAKSTGSSSHRSAAAAAPASSTGLPSPQAGGSRLGSAGSHWSNSRPNSSKWQKESPRVEEANGEEMTSATRSTRSSKKPIPPSPRLYSIQTTDPRLEAASWRRKLEGIQEEQEHMDVFLKRAKLLDTLFLNSS